MKIVVLFSLVVLVTLQTVSAEEFQCKEGESYTENECNSCFCTPNGKLGCTFKACIFPDGRDKNLRKCDVGTSFEKDCNKCWCVKDMGTVCTNKKC